MRESVTDLVVYFTGQVAQITREHRTDNWHMIRVDYGCAQRVLELEGLWEIR